MTTDQWIAVGGIGIGAVLTIANIVATLLANRPSGEISEITNRIWPRVVNGVITLLSLVGALLFTTSHHAASLFCWAVGAIIYSYFFLKTEAPPTRAGVFMLVMHFSAVISIALLSLIGRAIDNLEAVVEVLKLLQR